MSYGFPFRVLVFREFFFQEYHEFSTDLEARAFARGVNTGAALGSVHALGVYVLPEDEELMRAIQPAKEIARALERIQP